MPNPSTSEIIVVLDRSGSMEAIAPDMRGGFDRFVAEQRALPGECRLTLVQFDNEGIDTVYEARDLAAVPPLRFDPRGTTPLLDAVGVTIHRTGARFAALADAQRPGRVVFIIITDGQENASRVYTRPQIKALVERQTRDYAWQFVYLGANVDAYAEAGSMGVSLNSTSAYQPDSQHVQTAFRSVSDGTRLYRSASSLDRATPFTFTDDQKAAMNQTGTLRPSGGDATGPHAPRPAEPATP